MIFLTEAGHLFLTVILPVLLIIGFGALVQRSHPLDVNTLSKVQIYLFVPVFLFVRVFDSTLSWREIGGIAGAVLLAKVCLGIPLYFFLRAMKVKQETLGVVLLSSAIFNAGNFGIPVAERAFGPAGGAVQALVVMVANLSMWGIGYGLMAALSGKGKGAILGYFKLPMVYWLVAAFALRAFGVKLPEPIAKALHLIADGMVPIALITLGAQLAKQARWPRWRVVTPVLFLKLIAMPAITAAVVYFLGLWPWPGAVLIVAASAPAAVNTLLLIIEQKGDTELAADCVFWTTLISAVTVTLVLTLVKIAGGGPPGG